MDSLLTRAFIKLKSKVGREYIQQREEEYTHMSQQLIGLSTKVTHLLKMSYTGVRRVNEFELIKYEDSPLRLTHTAHFPLENGWNWISSTLFIDKEVISVIPNLDVFLIISAHLITKTRYTRTSASIKAIKNLLYNNDEFNKVNNHGNLSDVIKQLDTSHNSFKDVVLKPVEPMSGIDKIIGTLLIQRRVYNGVHITTCYYPFRCWVKQMEYAQSISFVTVKPLTHKEFLRKVHQTYNGSMDAWFNRFCL